MALSIKNREVENMVTELARRIGVSKTEIVRRALEEHRERLELREARHGRGRAFLRYLEEEVWPRVPAGQLGRRLRRDEEEEILGFGPGGV